MVDNKNEELELKFNSDAESDELALAREELAAELAAADDEDNAADLTVIHKTEESPAADPAAPDMPSESAAPNHVLRSRMPVNRPAGTPPLKSAETPMAATAAVRSAPRTYGALLRDLREQRKLSFQALEEATKIAPHYLKALEYEDLKSLPPLVYVIAYIRTLCRFYGIADTQSAEFIRELKSQMEYACTDELLSTVDIDHSGSETHERLLRRIILIAAGVFTLLIGGIALWVYLATRPAAPAAAPAVPPAVRSTVPAGAAPPASPPAAATDFDPAKLETLLEPPTLELTRLPVAE